MKLFKIACSALLLALVAPAAASNGDEDVAAVETAITGFIAALNRMDDDAVRAALVEDVSVFFPSTFYPLERVEGREAVAGWFGRLFEMLRAQGVASVGLEMKDLRITRYGDSALATFHLVEEDGAARRTLFLRRDGDSWRVVHLHGSNMSPPE